jgi:hypothetical protein
MVAPWRCVWAVRISCRLGRRAGGASDTRTFVLLRNVAVALGTGDRPTFPHSIAVDDEEPLVRGYAV